jgi:hypothetical protein
MSSPTLAWRILLRCSRAAFAAVSIAWTSALSSSLTASEVVSVLASWIIDDALRLSFRPLVLLSSGWRKLAMSPKRDPGSQSKSYAARGDGSAGRLGRPGKFVMHGVQGHGSAINGRGPELRKPPALIHLTDLRCLAKNAQNGIVFGSV